MGDARRRCQRAGQQRQAVDEVVQAGGGPDLAGASSEAIGQGVGAEGTEGDGQRAAECGRQQGPAQVAQRATFSSWNRDTSPRRDQRCSRSRLSYA